MALCAGCPVRAECLEAGRGATGGVWGGRRARSHPINDPLHSIAYQRKRVPPDAQRSRDYQREWQRRREREAAPDLETGSHLLDA
jgi:hypothetical protein